MKQETLSKWIQSLTNNDSTLEAYQKKGIKALERLSSSIKSQERLRLSNLSRIEKIFTLPIKSNKGDLLITLNSQNIFDNNSLPKGIERLEDNEIKTFINSRSYFEDYENYLESVNDAANKELIAFRVKEEKPISLELVLSNRSKELMPSRIILIIEKNTNLDLLQIFKGSENSAHSHKVDIFIEENSKVNHGIIAIGKESSKLLATVSIEQKKKTYYDLICFQEGWHLSHIEQNIIQLHGNANTNLNSLTIAKKDQQLATYSYVKFNGPNGILNQLNKALVDDSSHSIFHGIIDVPQIAQKTQASQLSKNLLLSSKGKVNTSPQLKIIADDVKCNHGATISQLDNEQIFYLKSRGINKETANSLLIKGFCKEIIDALPNLSKEWSHLSEYIND